MVKHLIRWVVCLCLCATGINTAWAETTTFDFTQITGFNSWGTSYTEHTVNYAEGTVTFSSANKQGQGNAITTMPVTKGQPVSFVMKEGMFLSGVEFQCKKWNDKKPQTITLNYSTDGGNNYTATSTTSSNFSLSANSLPEGTNAVKFTFSSKDNQIGIQSLTITYSASNDTREVVDITSFTAKKTTINIFETVTTTVANNRPSWTPAAYTYTSSNTDAATVDENGVITGKAAGNANIVVKANVANNDENYKAGKADTLAITVQDNRALVNLTGFTATKTTLTKGETTTTTVSNDQDGWTANYNYSSNKESVATVDEDGVITAVAKGQATITVTAVVDADDRGYKAGTTLTKDVVITVNNPKHTVTFMANGQSVSNEAMEEGATITFNDLDAQRVPEGQTFMGWAAAAFEGTQENAPALVKSATVGTTDVTYYAVFATGIPSENANWVRKTVSEVVANPEAGDYALITPDGHAYNGNINVKHVGQATSTAFAFTNNVATSEPEGTCLLKITRKGTDGIEIARKDNGNVIYAKAAAKENFYEGATQDSYWYASGSNLKYEKNDAFLRSLDNNSFRTYGSASNSAIAFAYRSSVTYTNYCTTVGGADTRKFVKFTAWNTNNGETTLEKGNTLTTVATLNPAECTTGTITYTSNNPEVATINTEGVITAVGKGEATLVATLCIEEDDKNYRLSQENKQTLTINVVNQEHTVTFMADGTMVEEKNVREEEAFSFPAVTAPEGLVFIGWTEKGLKGMATEAPALVDTTAAVMGEYDLTFAAVYARVAQKGEIKQYELTAEMIQEHFTQTAQKYGEDERTWSNDVVTWRFFGLSEKNGNYFQINSTKKSYISFTTPCAIKNIAFDVVNGSNKDYDGSFYIYDYTTDVDVTTVSVDGREACIAIDGNYNNLAIQSSTAARINNIVLTCQDEDRYLGYVTNSKDANTARTHVVTITASCGYTTVCLPYNAVASEGATLYALKSVDSEGLHFTSTDKLAAGQGYVLQGEADAQYTLYEVLEAVDYNANLLKGVVEQTNRVDLTLTGTDVDYAYPWILAKDGSFKRYTGDYIPAGKAYLDGALLQNLSNGEAGAATMRVIFETTEEQQTGLDQLSNKANGSALYYNLQGQRIAKPQTGALYIEQSGRKLLLRK